MSSESDAGSRIDGSDETRMITRHMGTKHILVAMLKLVKDPQTFKETVQSED